MSYQFALPESVVSFYDYFRLNVPIEDIVGALGFRFEQSRLTLPRSDESLPWLGDLRIRLEAMLPLVSFTSEMARREFLIAPVLSEAARHLGAKVRSEYPVNVSPQLRGNLDYLLIAEQRFLVVEAKNADMARGLAQLAAELAALDQWTDSDATCLYGAVSIGDTWQFAVLDRKERTLTQDIGRFLVPENLDNLLPTLIGILRGKDVAPK